jgi:hypothetical protein
LELDTQSTSLARATNVYACTRVSIFAFKFNLCRYTPECPLNGCQPCPENALWARVIVDIFKRVDFRDVLGGRASWSMAKEVQEVQVQVSWRVLEVGFRYQ